MTLRPVLLIVVAGVSAFLVVFGLVDSDSPGRERRAPAAVSPETARRLHFEGERLRDFPLLQSAPGAIAEVPDPAGGGRRVFRLRVREADVYPVTPTSNPRASLLTPANVLPGDTFWWRSEFFLPRNFPSRVPGWLTLLQGPYGAPFGGTPPFHLEVSGRHIQWVRNGTYNWDVPWRMPLVKGRWVEVLAHIRFARSGFVELWVDGKRVRFFATGGHNPNRHAPTGRVRMQTLDDSNYEGPNALTITSYRARGMFPAVTVFQAPTRVAATRAETRG